MAKGRLKAAARRAAGALPVLLRDLVGVAGAASIAYGAGLAWEPAGWMVGGLLALAAAVALSRGGA